MAKFSNATPMESYGSDYVYVWLLAAKGGMMRAVHTRYHWHCSILYFFYLYNILLSCGDQTNTGFHELKPVHSLRKRSFLSNYVLLLDTRCHPDQDRQRSCQERRVISLPCPLRSCLLIFKRIFTTFYHRQALKAAYKMNKNKI